MTRSSRPSATTWDEPTARSGRPGSLPIHLLEICLRHPVTSSGVLLSVVMIGVIVGNALGNQARRHPHPWFQTRTVADPAAPDVVPLPQRPPAAATSVPAAAPTTTPATLAPALPKPRPVGAIDQPSSLLDLQIALREHGLYTGPLDGVLGPATVEAIRAFERRIGAPVTGEPSELLLAAARALHSGVDPTTTASTPQPMQRHGETAPAVRAATPQATAPATAAVQPVRATGTPPMRMPVADAVAHPVGADVATELAEVDEVEAPVFTGSIRRAVREPLAAGGDVRLQKVQRRLVVAGYGPLKANGLWDDRSASAVRRFEADRGWPVTGRPSNRLVAELPAEPTAIRH